MADIGYFHTRFRHLLSNTDTNTPNGNPPPPIAPPPPVKKPPSLRNNNRVVQVRLRLDGRDHFINRIGRWDDPVAQAKATAIAAQIWSDYQQGVFDRSLMAYQPLINGKEVGLLEAVKAGSEEKRQVAPIHAYRVLKRYP